MSKVERLAAVYSVQRRFGFGAVEAARNALKRRVREEIASSMLEFLPSHVVNEGGCFVDVGAHHGKWTSSVLRLASPTEVVIIEPTPTTVEHLRQRFPDEGRVRVVEAAAGSEAGIARLRIFEGSDLNSLHAPLGALRESVPKGSRELRELDVQVVRLDDVVNEDQKVTVMKIDAQGGELDVLAGATETLTRTRAVILEVAFRSQYEGAPGLCDLVNFFSPLGFTFHRFTHLHHDDGGRLIWTDAAFVNDSTPC